MPVREEFTSIRAFKRDSSLRGACGGMCHWGLALKKLINDARTERTKIWPQCLKTVLLPISGPKGAESFLFLLGKRVIHYNYP